jgi:hypothetical protein
MSPEQVLGQPAGPASDLFSLGTVAYELLTGRHPFAADSTVETMHRILHDSPDPPSRLNPALTPEFDFVFAKALTKDPGRRHSSAHDLDIDLETVECGCVSEASSKAEATSGPRAIAVLPFKNIGGSQDLNYLGVGLADAVITRLMNSPDLVVRSTGSIAVYENQPVEPRRVGQELDVTARDADRIFHETWLGLAQPIEGLVFSVPVLAEAQIAPRLFENLPLAGPTPGHLDPGAGIHESGHAAKPPLPPRRRNSACWARISSAKFHDSSST